MLLAVDLHLQVNLACLYVSRLRLEPTEQRAPSCSHEWPSRVGGRRSQHKRIVMLLLLHHRLAYPRECIPQVGYRLLDWLRLHLHQVDVLRITRLRMQIQFPQCRAAPESQVRGKERIIVNRAQDPADEQILLNELIRHPRSRVGPRCNVSFGNRRIERMGCPRYSSRRCQIRSSQLSITRFLQFSNS